MCRLGVSSELSMGKNYICLAVSVLRLHDTAVVSVTLVVVVMLQRLSFGVLKDHMYSVQFSVVSTDVADLCLAEH